MGFWSGEGSRLWGGDLRMHVAQQVEEGWQQVALAAGKQAAHAAAKGLALARALPRELQRRL